MFANPPAERAPLTLVTAYFALPRRSRTVSDYHAWMSNLLPFVEWPLVIFCDAESLAVIKRLRGGKPAAYRVTRLQDFRAYRHRDAICAHAMQRLGRPAGQTIGIDAALVWHEKANFVRRAIAENPYRSEMFFWCDIGLLRRGVFRPSPRRAWPNLQICREKFADRPVFFGRQNAPPPAESGLDYGGILGRRGIANAPILRCLLPFAGFAHLGASRNTGRRAGAAGSRLSHRGITVHRHGGRRLRHARGHQRRLALATVVESARANSPRAGC